MRRVMIIAWIAVGHALGTVACGLGEHTSSRFLWNPPSQSHAAWAGALRVLEFPLLALVRARDPRGLPFYVPVMILNSLLWAVVIYLAARALGAWRGSRVATADDRVA
jgi:hypothetical protein